MGGIMVAGVVVSAIGLASRRPWARRYWSGGGEPTEVGLTLIMPPFGLLMISGALGTAIDEQSALRGVLLVVFGLSLLATGWVVLSLPVPDRFLVKGSSIRSARARRRARRARRKEGR